MINPCKKCGAVDRYKNGHCKPCHRAAVSKWQSENVDKTKADRSRYYAENRDKALKYRSEYYAANPDRAKSAQKKYYASNSDNAKSRSIEWKLANREKIKEYHARYRIHNRSSVLRNNQNYRARKRSALGVLSSGLTERLLVLQKGKCACCGLSLGNDYHLDHIIPLALGGSNEDGNIQLLRGVCNMKKGMKHPVVFMQSRGYLL